MTEQQDIVVRLKERAGKYDEYDWHGAIELEAAETITVLRREVAHRNQRLLQFAGIAIERDSLRALLMTVPLVPFKVAPHGPPVRKPKGPRK